VIYDAVVVGAGMGGLACASRLAREGLRVVVLEKCPHVGGTSYIFRRKGHAFPMGPLAFSFPQKVKTLLDEACELPGKLLVETPIPNLLTAGINAATELFLGGVPTALHTGMLAARLILEG
jgi:phytoene dehydrogenase-like protein